MTSQEDYENIRSMNDVQEDILGQPHNRALAAVIAKKVPSWTVCHMIFTIFSIGHTISIEYVHFSHIFP